MKDRSQVRVPLIPAGWPFGLKGPGMHDFILRECEVGYRVAHAEDDEDCGFGPLFDLSYMKYVLAQERQTE